MSEGDFAGRAFHDDGPGIAHPAAMGRDAEEVHVREICAGLLQNDANPRFGLAVLNQEVNALSVREMAHELRERPANRAEFAGPVGKLMWPGEPRGFMIVPLRRHPEALCTRNGL